MIGRQTSMRTKEDWQRLRASAKGIKPSDWHNWPIVKQADTDSGQVRRDPSGRHWEGITVSRYKAHAFPVPNPSQGAPSTQPFSGEEEEQQS